MDWARIRDFLDLNPRHPDWLLRKRRRALAALTRWLLGDIDRLRREAASPRRAGMLAHHELMLEIVEGKRAHDVVARASDPSDTPLLLPPRVSRHDRGGHDAAFLAGFDAANQRLAKWADKELATLAALDGRRPTPLR